jgi:hypothetical protein
MMSTRVKDASEPKNAAIDAQRATWWPCCLRCSSDISQPQWHENDGETFEDGLEPFRRRVQVHGG